METFNGKDLEELFETIMYPALQDPRVTQRRDAIDEMVNLFIDKLPLFYVNELLDILHHISDEDAEKMLLSFKKGIEYGIKYARNTDSNN